MRNWYSVWPRRDPETQVMLPYFTLDWCPEAWRGTVMHHIRVNFNFFFVSVEWNWETTENNDILPRRDYIGISCIRIYTSGKLASECEIIWVESQFLHEVKQGKILPISSPLQHKQHQICCFCSNMHTATRITRIMIIIIMHIYESPSASNTKLLCREYGQT